MAMGGHAHTQTHIYRTTRGSYDRSMCCRWRLGGARRQGGKLATRGEGPQRRQSNKRLRAPGRTEPVYVANETLPTRPPRCPTHPCRQELLGRLHLCQELRLEGPHGHSRLGRPARPGVPPEALQHPSCRLFLLCKFLREAKRSFAMGDRKPIVGTRSSRSRHAKRCRGLKRPLGHCPRARMLEEPASRCLQFGRASADEAGLVLNSTTTLLHQSSSKVGRGVATRGAGAASGKFGGDTI